MYYQTWELAFRNIEYIEKAGWKPQLTCMPGVGIVWQWDSCFMTFITNYANGTLTALNNLDNLYRLRRTEDGYMSMAYCIEEETPAYDERINPPLMAWAEWEAYCVSGDASRLAQVLPALEGCYEYIEKHHTRSCGLYWFEDSGSSGMDNSPRGGYPSLQLNGSDLCHVDLACQQALSAQCLARICHALGNDTRAAFYKDEHARICKLINRYHWSDKAGCYMDFFIRGNPDDKVKYLNSKTAASFWALLCGAAQGEQQERMVQLLFNPDVFYTKVPFATLSRDDPNYDATGGYWLGGVWAPTNYAAIRGLTQCGKPELAREAAIRYLDAICAVSQNPAYGSIWECYAPEAYLPSTAEKGELVRPDFVGWSGLVPITMLIENIIGLRFDAPSNAVEFCLLSHNRCGLRNMVFNGNRVSVECTDYVPSVGKSTLRVTAEKPLTVKVQADHLPTPICLAVLPGEHTFTV